MRRAARWVFAVVAAGVCFGAAAGAPDAAPELTAEQIAEKNAAARGGVEAWRKVETMAWVGRVGAGSAAGPGLPFVLEMKRPNKTRFMVTAAQQISLRIFDGKNGWKLRSAAGGPPDLQPFSAEEAAFARDNEVIDGPLIDYREKGIAVALEAVDEIDGGKAYRMLATLPSGASHRVWVDARSFLDVKSERAFRTASGVPATMTKRYGDYRVVDGLLLPFTVESRGRGGRIINRMVIDKVLLNPPLEDRVFAKPQPPAVQHSVSAGSSVAPAAWPAREPARLLSPVAGAGDGH